MKTSTASSARQIVSRVTALLLILVFALSATACANNGKTPAETTSSGEGTATPDETTASLFEPDDLPAQLNLNETVTMLYWEDFENVEFFVEDEGSDSVEYAIKNRNAKVLARLGVEIDFVPTPGNYNNRSNFEKTVYADFSGSNSYDIYAAYSMSVANCAYSGYCANLYDYSVINFEKPWWPKKLTSEAVINNKLYFASGDISTNMLYMMYVMYFSKPIVTDNGIESPYDCVDKGTWTIDKMIEMAAVIANDLDDDNKIYGLATSSNVHYDPFFYGAGLRTLDRAEDGSLIISDLFGSERAQNTATKMAEFLNNGQCTASKGQELFRDGRALFSVNRARYASQFLSDTDMGFGIVPMPKYDETQEEYATCLGFPYTLYAISSGSRHAEAAAYLLEALASESYRTVTPALFEVSMKIRYVDDPIAARMFDIVHDGVSFDVGRIFCSSLDTITFRLFRDVLTNNTSYATEYAKKKIQLNVYLKKFVEQFDKIA